MTVTSGKKALFPLYTETRKKVELCTPLKVYDWNHNIKMSKSKLTANGVVNYESKAPFGWYEYLASTKTTRTLLSVEFASGALVPWWW